MSAVPRLRPDLPLVETRTSRAALHFAFFLAASEKQDGKNEVERRVAAQARSLLHAAPSTPSSPLPSRTSEAGSGVGLAPTVPGKPLKNTPSEKATGELFPYAESLTIS